MKKVRNYGKISYFKNIFENGWWEDAYFSSYFLDPSQAISYRIQLAYFNHLAPLILFFFYQNAESKRGEAWHNGLP